MTLHDTVELPPGLALPGLDRDPSTIDWQTESIDGPLPRTLRVTADGRLLEAETRCELVPAEGPYLGTERWEQPPCRGVGSIQTSQVGWSERPYHGVVRLVARCDSAVLAYEVKFTDGRLVAVREVGPGTPPAWRAVEWADDEQTTARADGDG